MPNQWLLRQWPNLCPPAAVSPRKEPEFLRRTEPTAIEQVVVAPDEVKMVDTDAAEVAELTAGTDGRRAPVARIRHVPGPRRHHRR